MTHRRSTRTDEQNVLTPAEARSFLIGQTRLRVATPGAAPTATRALLQQLRCIQLDPIDRLGTNADLVAMARVDGLAKGDVYRHLLPGNAFEHFAKERCLLPPQAFPAYRHQSAETPWWRLTERLRRLSEETIAAVLDEVRVRGPLGASELTDRGRVQALDWSGWKGTSRAASMALEVLWTRCQIVVCERTPQGKRFDVPERALPHWATEPWIGDGDPEAFARWALLERVEAAGLLARAGGAHWSMLRDARTNGLPERLIRQGDLEEVSICGSSRRYLAPAGFRDRQWPDDDGRMRILGPLDPLIWDRNLTRHIFDFEYVWEVYKPAHKRRWGYYVCPLLHGGELVGRFEGHLEGNEMVVDERWPQPDRPFDEIAWHEAVARHARSCARPNPRQSQTEAQDR